MAANPRARGTSFAEFFFFRQPFRQDAERYAVGGAAVGGAVVDGDLDGAVAVDSGMLLGAGIVKAVRRGAGDDAGGHARFERANVDERRRHRQVVDADNRVGDKSDTFHADLEGGGTLGDRVGRDRAQFGRGRARNRAADFDFG